jgi:hypothetical protein
MAPRQSLEKKNGDKILTSNLEKVVAVVASRG